ncbi:MAG: S-layer homology domain-containing protein, partial [Oscillospiraceae bacterium]|nr:S-layer homology domain-containing protein [Oscillospiraceae bacterium]
ATIAVMLWRLEGSPAASGDLAFSDVLENYWYTEGIRWAASAGVITGYDGKFNPDADVTREQLATMLFRYAQYKGMDVSIGEDTNILSYADALSVSDYAVSAMQWVCGAGIVNGMERDGDLVLAPGDASSRAVVATMLMRFGKQ